VDVYSEPGHGTTFKIYLPAVEDEEDKGPPTPPRACTPRRSETIVLVEDEDGLRALIRESPRGRAATGWWRRRIPSAGWPRGARQPQGIDLLMTDVILPQMRRERAGGPGAGDLARGPASFSCPATPDEAIGQHAVLAPGPVPPEALHAGRALAKVRAVLEGPGRRPAGS
jgi:hypothetical protein